jgi:hypothetical protein
LIGTRRIDEIWENASSCTGMVDQLMKRKNWKLKIGDFFNFPSRIEIEIDLNFF